MLVTVTISPSPDPTRAPSRARVIRIVPITFASYIQRHCSSSASATGSRPRAPPAVVRSRSQRGRRAAKASPESGWVTSRAIASAAPISSAISSRRSSRRAPRTTRNPSPASARAVAAPIPLDAPVTTAVLLTGGELTHLRQVDPLQVVVPVDRRGVEGQGLAVGGGKRLEQLARVAVVEDAVELRVGPVDLHHPRHPFRQRAVAAQHPLLGDADRGGGRRRAACARPLLVPPRLPTRHA